MSLMEPLYGLGLFGVFSAAFLGHFSIVMKDILFVPLFLYMSQSGNPLLLGLVGGLGGGLGEISSYFAGRGVWKLAANRESQPDLPTWMQHVGLFSVLLSSLTPLPDAPVLLLLGSAQFPLLPVIVLEILGKTIFYTVIALTGGLVYSHLNGILPTPWNSLLTLFASLSFTLLLTWRRTRDPLLKFASNTVKAIRKTLTRDQASEYDG